MDLYLCNVCSPQHFHPRLCIELCGVINGTLSFYLVRLNKVKCGEEKSRVIKFTLKICHQLEKLRFLPPFLGIIVNLTHLVYVEAKKLCSSISVYKVRLL